MKPDQVKSIAGLLSIITLLGLIVIDMTSQQYELTDKYLYLLLLLISAFLGIDLLGWEFRSDSYRDDKWRDERQTNRRDDDE